MKLKPIHKPIFGCDFVGIPNLNLWNTIPKHNTEEKNKISILQGYLIRDQTLPLLCSSQYSCRSKAGDGDGYGRSTALTRDSDGLDARQRRAWGDDGYGRSLLLGDGEIKWWGTAMGNGCGWGWRRQLVGYSLLYFVLGQWKLGYRCNFLWFFLALIRFLCF